MSALKELNVNNPQCNWGSIAKYKLFSSAGAEYLINRKFFFVTILSIAFIPFLLDLSPAGSVVPSKTINNAGKTP